MGRDNVRAFLRRVQPLSLCALLATLLLFRFQGDQLIHQPAAIALRAVPILIQVYPNSGGTTRGTGSPVSSIASQGLQR